MAENMNEQEVQKTTEKETTAPVTDKPEVEKTENMDAEKASDTIDETLAVLNVLDKQNGGTGSITEVPEAMKAVIKSLIDNLVLVRDLFEDPLWKAILDDMADQKEDGKTPSVEVAIARNIPLENLQGLAESEDYEGVQSELSSSISAKKEAAQMESEYESSFEESKMAGEEYAKEMGYSEEERNSLFQMVLDLMQILADGKLTKEEFRKVDQMRNYDKDVEALRSQIQPEAKKEVLPDKASVEAAMQNKQAKPQPKAPMATPGLSSMTGPYANATTDYTKTGPRNRKR